MSSELVHGIYWDRWGEDWTSNNTAWRYEVDRDGDVWRWRSRAHSSHPGGTASTREDAMLEAIRHYVSSLREHATAVENGV